MEVRGPDGTWRADVLVSDPAGTWRMALEAQLAPITAADITARTERMQADGVRSIWFSDRPRVPWLGFVPSVRLARPDDGEGLVIAEGLAKFIHAARALTSTDSWALTGKRSRPPWSSSSAGRSPASSVLTSPRYRDAMIWSARRYIAEEKAAADRYESLYAATQRPEARRLARRAGIPLSRAAAIMASACLVTDSRSACAR
jgi:competence protein CoiA